MLITSHSDKEGAAGTFKGGYALHPVLAYCDETGAALGGLLGPATWAPTPPLTRSRRRAGLQRIPREHVEDIENVVRADSAGATHELLDFGEVEDRGAALVRQLIARPSSATGPQRQ